MPGNKYLKIGTTGFTTEEASINSSSGAGDANKLISADATGKLDSTLLPAGLGADSATLTAGEALSAGNLVYISAAGTVLKADANAVAKAAVGFVLASVANAATGTVYFEGSITGLTGLTPGATYFLSGAATGAITTTIPTAAGSIVQQVGVATSATTLTFEAGEPIVRA